MGRMQAEELAGLIGDIKMETALSMHLTSNHYPPVPTSMVKPCIEAIDNANAGDWNALVELPEGVSWRGETHAPTHAIIEGHHLDSFLDYDEDAEF